MKNKAEEIVDFIRNMPKIASKETYQKVVSMITDFASQQKPEIDADKFIEKWNVGYEDLEQKLEFENEMRNDLKSMLKPEIPEDNRQKLFNHMSNEHGLTLLESEMNDIYSICIGHEEYVKYLNWLHSSSEMKPIGYLVDGRFLDSTTFQGYTMSHDSVVVPLYVKPSDLQEERDDYLRLVNEGIKECEKLTHALKRIESLCDESNETVNLIWRIANQAVLTELKSRV